MADIFSFASNNSFTQKYVLIKYVHYIISYLVKVTGQNV